LIKATLIDHMGTDLSVVNAARVSFGKSSTFDGRVGGPNVLKVADVKLVKYLAEHEHFSPFGHCFASFHVKAPIFVARQLVKHKFLRWNEISRRYVSDNPEFYRPDEWRGKADDKKQGSAGVVEVEDVLEETHGQALVTYQELLDKGVCPEQARMVLPQSTMTEWYWSGSLDAFADMVKLRVSGDTQKETRDLAWQIDEAMLKLFPVSWDALVYGDDK
jgi:thymidylate synthase (FAD)|tara:strand:+ start:668 stop:1321 length:654 start_codon:yes stop_codon:yes gene_type:complete